MSEHMKRILIGLAGLVLAAGVSDEPEASPAADQDTIPGVGVVTHALNQASVDRLVDLGVDHVRYTLYWSRWHEEDYRAGFRRDIDRAVRAGLEPLIVVHQQPNGGYGDRERVYREFAAFIEARAREFPQVRAWQLWNEMDVAFTDVFGAGRDDIPMRQRGRNYADMLRLAYPAVKRGNQDALVVTGGLASGPEDGFIHGIYDGNGPFDVLAIHSYGFPIPPAFEAKGLATRRIMQANGDTRPLWNTEFGMEKAVVPMDWPRTRADVDRYHLEAWRESLLTNQRRGIYERAYGYALQHGGDESFDLIRQNGSPRPAYSWLREWMRQRER